MASYKLLIKRSAARELEGLPPKVRRRVAGQIETLTATPRPQGVEKLSGQEKYRIRQGDYRVLYSIDDRAQTVTVVKVRSLASWTSVRARQGTTLRLP